MSDLHRLHAALFDELARQGIVSVDVYALTRAVVRATGEVALTGPALRVEPPNPRCANGACE